MPLPSWLALLLFVSGLMAPGAARASADAAAPDRVALVIGNAAYAQAPLRNPVNDARAMAARLRELGFEVQLLTDADRQAMERAVVGFSQRLTPRTTALVYYAGHGVQARGRNYLLPVDAAPDSEAALRFAGIDVSAMIEEISQAGAQAHFVILDACRDNPFEARTRGRAAGLAAIDAARGTLIAYATAPGAVADDGDGANGLYTAELMRALAVPGLMAEEVFKRTRIAVAERSRGRQIPWESSSLTGDFVFNRSAAAQAAATATPAEPVETTLWQSAREIDTPAAYRAYLEHYPEGTFAALARLRADAAAAAAAAATAPATTPAERPAPPSTLSPSSPPSPAPAPLRCAAAGAWINTVPGLNCQSTVRLSERADGEFDLRESGCGNVRGRARFIGSQLLAEWSAVLGLCRGRTEIDFDADCQRGQGKVVMPANMLACSGRHAVTWERMSEGASAR